MWTHEHIVTLLPAVGVYLAIAIILALLLKNKSDTIRMIPTMIIGMLLLVLEIIKQVYSIINGYTYWILPFHFCSQFFWMIPLMGFYFGKRKYLVRSVATTASMMLFLFLMLYPQSIYGAGSIRSFSSNFLSFHAVAFHNLVILNLFIVVALNVNRFSLKRDIIANIIVFGVYCLIGAIMANVLKTNYNNFYFAIVDWAENIRQFFITHIGTIGGQTVYLILFSLLIVAGSILSYLVLIVIKRLVNIKYKKNTT